MWILSIFIIVTTIGHKTLLEEMTCGTFEIKTLCRSALTLLSLLYSATLFPELQEVSVTKLVCIFPERVKKKNPECGHLHTRDRLC